MRPIVCDKLYPINHICDTCVHTFPTIASQTAAPSQLPQLANIGRSQTVILIKSRSLVCEVSANVGPLSGWREAVGTGASHWHRCDPDIGGTFWMPVQTFSPMYHCRRQWISQFWHHICRACVQTICQVLSWLMSRDHRFDDAVKLPLHCQHHLPLNQRAPQYNCYRHPARNNSVRFWDVAVAVTVAMAAGPTGHRPWEHSAAAAAVAAAGMICTFSQTPHPFQH